MLLPCRPPEPQATLLHQADRPPADCRILLAEDNPVNALLARTLIGKAGCQCVLARDGAEAVDAFHRALEGREPPFDLILMDIHMPGCDGLEATRRLRALAGSAHRCPPVIALSASAFPEDRRRCLSAGMQDYLAKPFSLADFRAMLDRWLPHAVAALDASGARHVRP